MVRPSDPSPPRHVQANRDNRLRIGRVAQLWTTSLLWTLDLTTWPWAIHTFGRRAAFGPPPCGRRVVRLASAPGIRQLVILDLLPSSDDISKIICATVARSGRMTG
jgi:hypothetical protein